MEAILKLWRHVRNLTSLIDASLIVNDAVWGFLKRLLQEDEKQQEEQQQEEQDE